MKSEFKSKTSNNLLIHLTENELGEIIERTFEKIFQNQKTKVIQTQNKKSSTKELISSADLIQELSISKTTMYNWIKNGNLPRPIKLGKLIYFHRKDLERVVEQKRSGNEGL